MREDVYETILREIPQLGEDKPMLALLASSCDSNVETCLQIMRYRIDLDSVQAPAAAVEYARLLAQRGTPLTALLRAYRVGHACFADWVLKELAQQAHDAEMISAAMLCTSRVVAEYIDHISEQMVAAYAEERDNWLRNRSAAKAARVRDLLSGERIDASAAEATLGYRLRQYHVGVVCWVGDAARTADEITRLSTRSATSQAGRPAAATRCSCPATSRAPGPGCRWGSGTPSTPARPTRPTSTLTSISPSAMWPRARRGSASPTSRPSPPAASRSPPDLPPPGR